MTRNTKFYKFKAKPTDIYYRDLTANELAVLGNIKNDAIRYEMAANMAISKYDPEQLSFPIKTQIGEDVITRSSALLNDGELLDITITDFRNNLREDPVLAWISHLLKYFPGTSIIELFNLNLKDLIELVVLAEEISGEKIFGSKKKGMTLINPADLPDGGKALREEIRNLNGVLQPRPAV